jgi:hypothetical protein
MAVSVHGNSTGPRWNLPFDAAKTYIEHLIHTRAKRLLLNPDHRSVVR